MDTNLKQYNIYAGIIGYGGLEYKYTTLAESIEEAEKIAHDEAEDEFDLVEPYSFDDSIDEVLDADGDPNADPTQEQLDIANANFEVERETYLDFKAVLTSEDTISQDDLILDYIVDDSSETDGSGE